MMQLASDGYNNAPSHYLNTYNTNRDGLLDYKVKFMQSSVENDRDLIEKHYCEFKPENHLNNKMLLETKSYYEDLEEKISKALADKNINQEFIDKTWQSASDNFGKHLEKCISHETFVKQIQAEILNHGYLSGTDKPKSFIDAKNMAEQLNVKHKQVIDNLKFNSEQVVKQFVAKGLEISGQLPEDSSIILEIKSIGENLEEAINKSLADKNIDEEIKNQVWELPYYSSKYKQVLDKLKTHEQWVRVYEDKILNCDTLSESNSLNMELKKIHNDAKNELSFHTNQVIRHFYIKALQISNQSLEESPMILDIKNVHKGLKEKINKNYEDNLINEKIKSAVEELFNPKCNQHLEKLKLIEKSVRQYEDQLLMCDNFQQSKIIVDSLNKKQKEIDNWKLESVDLIEEIMNKATEFAYKELEVGNSEIDNSFKINTTHSILLEQQSLINPIEIDQSINSLVLGGDSRLLEIKNLLSNFKEKLNASLDENSNIHQKIKFDVCKIYKSRCEQHLENLKLIEKSVAKYEALPNSQKTEKNINHLAKRYKEIDKWKIDSDNLVEKITVQALELSYKIQPNLNEQNNLQVQKLMDEMVELKNMVKMNQNNIEKPFLENLDFSINSEGSYDVIKVSSKKENNPMDGLGIQKPNVEPNLAQDLEAKIKLKGEIKGDIRMIKLAVKTNMPDEEIKPFIKKITNKIKFDEIKEIIISNPIGLNDDGYDSGLAGDIMDDM